MAGVSAISALSVAACGGEESAAPPESNRVFITTSATTTSSSAAARTPGARQWAGNGVFSVGATPTGGARAAIPPGRYRVELDDGNVTGLWVRCTGLPCSPASSNHIDMGFADGAGFSTVADVAPTDGAVYLERVVFTAVG